MTTRAVLFVLLGWGVLTASVSAAADAPAPSATGADAQAALEAAAERAQRHPDDLEALFQLGLAQQAANRPEDAIATYGRILEKDPRHVKALVHEGLALEDSNKHEQAEALYRRAIEVAPNDPLPYINLGSLLYFHSKKTFEAKSALTQALALDPENPDAHFNLGVLFADAGLYREAMVEWEKVLAVGADGPAAALAKDNLDRIRPLLGEGGVGNEKDAPEGDESHEGHSHP